MIDLIVISNKKEKLEEAKNKIIKYLNDENTKTKISHIKNIGHPLTYLLKTLNLKSENNIVIYHLEDNLQHITGKISNIEKQFNIELNCFIYY